MATADGGGNKVLARRSAVLMARQTGIKFYRFRSALAKISRGDVDVGDKANLDKTISEDMVQDKKDVRRNLRTKGSFASGFVVGESATTLNEQEEQLKKIDDKALEDIEQRKKQTKSRLDDPKLKALTEQEVADKPDSDDDNYKDGPPETEDPDSPDESLTDEDKKKKISLSKASKVGGAAGIALTAASVAGVACVMRDIAGVVVDMNQLRVNQMVDTYASLLTTSSQLKANELSGDVVGNLYRRFDGFYQSANYQVFNQNQPASAYIGKSGDFSKEFSPGNASGFLIGTLFKVKTAIDKVKGGSLCGALNNRLVKWIIKNSAIPLLVGGAVLSVATGGLAGGVIFGGSALAGWIVGNLAGDLIGEQLESELNEAIGPINEEFEGVVGGTSSVLSPVEGDGARNYALVDYGGHYLKEQQMIMEGGEAIEVEVAVGNTVAYLEENRQAWKDRGLLANIFNPNNPYSLVSGMFYRSPNETMLAGVGRLAQTSTKIFPTVTASTQVSNQDLAALLYPGQTHVIDFKDKYVDFEDRLFDEDSASVGFDFASNTNFVENIKTGDPTKWAEWKEKYSKCLVVPVGGFVVAQSLTAAGIWGVESHISDDDYSDITTGVCKEENAARYKLYYQDCNHIANIAIGGQNLSPMNDTGCDYLLPDSWNVDNLAQNKEGVIGFNYNDVEHFESYLATVENQTPTSPSSFIFKDSLIKSFALKLSLWRI